LIGSRVNGVLPGYTGRFESSGTVTSMSFMAGRAGDNSTAAAGHGPAEVLTAEQFDLASGPAYD